MSVALPAALSIAEPWQFASVWLPKFRSVRAPELTGGWAAIQVVQGVCHGCKRPVKNVAVIWSARSHERLTIGFECMDRLAPRLSPSDRIRYETQRKRVRQICAEALKERRRARTHARFAALLAELAAYLRDETLPTATRDAARALERQIMDGHPPTKDQLARHEFLAAECRPSASSPTCPACGYADCVKVCAAPYWRTCPAELTEHHPHCAKRIRDAMHGIPKDPK